MDLPRESCEYVLWPLTGVPDAAALEASLTADPEDDPSQWVAMETVEGGARLLLAGPDAPSPGTAITLPLGRTFVKIRLTANPEKPVRRAHTIDVQ